MRGPLFGARSVALARIYRMAFTEMTKAAAFRQEARRLNLDFDPQATAVARVKTITDEGR
jgi:hypothetical protein